MLFQVNVFAELSSSSCALLRTTSSLATIVPEMAQLAMRYYRSSSSSSSNPAEHHREKRFLSSENLGKGRSSVVEQVIINTIRDVNFTHVAISILNNNETMNKIQQNIDSDIIIRIILRELDYEKLGKGLWSTIQTEFDLEHTISSVINRTGLDIIHDELFINGTLPEWFIKRLHPDLNILMIQKIFSTLKNVTYRFVEVLSKSERYDNYLFNMIMQQALTPFDNIIQRVKTNKPKTFDQLSEIIVNNINGIAVEQCTTKTKSPASAIETVNLNNTEEVKLMLYQWSVAINSMGQTARIMLKSLEQLYCTSVWE